MAHENAMNGSSTEPDTSLAKMALLTPAQGDAEALLRSTLDALSAHVAVLDETGAIVMVNQAWKEFAISTATRDEILGLERTISQCASEPRLAVTMRDAPRQRFAT